MASTSGQDPFLLWQDDKCFLFSAQASGRPTAKVFTAKVGHDCVGLTGTMPARGGADSDGSISARRCGHGSPCEQLCYELHDGMYECDCSEGFELNKNGYSCQAHLTSHCTILSHHLPITSHHGLRWTTFVSLSSFFELYGQLGQRCEQPIGVTSVSPASRSSCPMCAAKCHFVGLTAIVSDKVVDLRGGPASEARGTGPRCPIAQYCITQIEQPRPGAHLGTFPNTIANLVANKLPVDRSFCDRFGLAAISHRSFGRHASRSEFFSFSLRAASSADDRPAVFSSSSKSLSTLPPIAADEEER
uniref:Uncharacterized protein n=1 Tax=Anopheles atroparvus TaxID=41427 RepID=A0A182JHM7_ANOAO